MLAWGKAFHLALAWPGSTPLTRAYYYVLKKWCWSWPVYILLVKQLLLTESQYWGSYLHGTHLYGCCFHSPSQIARFMGPTWDPPGADRTQVGPMLAPWILLSGIITWVPFQYKDHIFCYSNFHFKDKHSCDHLIFITGFPILVRWHLHIETVRGFFMTDP